TRCTSKTDSLWRALYHATLIPGLRPGGLALGYKHSAPLGLDLRSHTHTPTVLSRSSIIPLRARTRCTSKTHSLWRALHQTTLILWLRPGGLGLCYKHSAPLGLVLLYHTHTTTIHTLSSHIPLRAKTRCTSKTHSLWRALHHTTLIPGLRPGGLALGYKHSAPLGLGERLKS